MLQVEVHRQKIGRNSEQVEKLDWTSLLPCLLRPENSNNKTQGCEVQVIVLIEAWYKLLTSQKATPGGKATYTRNLEGCPKGIFNPEQSA